MRLRGCCLVQDGLADALLNHTASDESAHRPVRDRWAFFHQLGRFIWHDVGWALM
jgi:hypothetical protein